MSWIISLIIVFLGLYATTRYRLPLLSWTVWFGVVLLILSISGTLPGLLGFVLWIAFIAMALLNVSELRRRFLSQPILRYIRRSLPPISDTEREAIEAGTTWWEAELFQGNPDWEKFDDIPAPQLSSEEQAFLDGPVEKLCEMLDDWQITHELNDLPKEIWEFMAKERFWSINIPKKYGGLEFSAEANSAIVVKIATRSGTAAVTVMVPNSLGPAELLLHYGTEGQKDYYLPRLATGEEIPCFGLTNPHAGSDASAIPDYGIVCKGKYKGEDVLGFRVWWDKRYITLGPVATLLGLAFKAYDPDHLLSETEDLGMTCALVPTDTDGITIGERHYPLNAAFQNGPNRGDGVFIPIDWVIGGQEQVGKGWRMLMESLAVGRAISLPASGLAVSKLSARVTGAYARVRQQFGISIGKFEGVEESLARIGGLTYMMDAGRSLTNSGLKLGEKPSVISAILKYHLTEGARQVVNDAMDVHGGRGICMGPSNYLARGYQQIPIAITVEGANILTRSMIIFGQGAMRCHPYLLKEIELAQSKDELSSEDAFDGVLLSHLGYTAINGIRSLVYALSASRLAPGGSESKITGAYYRKFSRYSATFAFLSDLTLLILGGLLKRKEKLSGRFADALSYLYLGTACLKHHKNAGEPKADLPLLEWACQHCLFQVQTALDGVLRNFPVTGLGWILRVLVFPLGMNQRRPDDRLGHKVARLLLEPSDTRDRLTAGMYINDDPEDIIGCLEDALKKTLAAEPIEKKLKEKGHRYEPKGDNYEDWLSELVQESVLSHTDAEILSAARDASTKIIQVDHFPAQSTLFPAVANTTNNSTKDIVVEDGDIDSENVSSDETTETSA